MSHTKTTVTAQGDVSAIELPRPQSAAWKPGTEVSLLSWGPEAALLLRGGGPPPGFVAANLATFGVDELFGHVLSNVLTGKLIVSREGARKTVSFRDGQVVFATSTEPWQRLGKALVDLNLITQEQLEVALEEVRPGTRLGQVLTSQGILTPARLYAGMTFLVREIVLNLFTAQDGFGLFIEGVPPPDDELKLPDPTRDLALDGVRRAEEMRRLRARLKRDLRVAQGKPAPEGPGAALWEKASAGQELWSLRAGFAGSDYAFLSLVSELLEQGVLTVKPRTHDEAPPPASAASLPALDRYAEVIRAACAALVEHGLSLEDLRSFLADPLPGMEGAFKGVTLSDLGEMNVAQVLENAGGAQRAEAKARAYEALDAFVSYAVFSARNVLPPAVAEGLSQKVRALHQEVSK